MARAELPSGTITLLFTDVEGSTRLLHELGDAHYAASLAEHRGLLRAAFDRHGGVEVDTQGDAFFVVFPSADGALSAASESRSSLEATPIRVRMGIHTGTPLRTSEGYVGADVHRAARIAAAGHGGQILVSSTTAAHVDARDAELVDLGEHRLKDLAAAERIYQLGGGDFQPLKAISASNLPVPATPFLGRSEELDAVCAGLADPACRLLTLTGTGGIGKTRLALQAAAESSDAFPGGLWWVPLAPLRVPALVLSSIAEVLQVREAEDAPLLVALSECLGGSRTLVLLDNAEHLLPELAEDVAALLAASASVTVLATSRERLQITPERVIEVQPLVLEDAEAFFCTRAAAHGVAIERSRALAELCNRLDRVPLALQLAAARTRTFSIDQLSERLSGRLDLLRGERDLEPRQRTLRATLDWSHDLLTAEEASLFRRLSVFAGGCTLNAVEEVCAADADALEGLADKSLVQRRDEDGAPRFWQLETIREFAAERLAEAGDTAELRRGHAVWFHRLADDAARWLRAGEPEEVAVRMLEDEIDNLRAAVAYGLETGDIELVREITAALPLYWVDRGLFEEARAWLERALALDDREDVTRLRLLSALAGVAYEQGDHTVAVEASDAAGELAMRLAGVTERYERLDALAEAAEAKGDLARAEELLTEALDAAIESDNGVGMSASRLALASLAIQQGRLARAAKLLDENLPFVRSRGQTRCEGFTLMHLAELALHRGESRAATEQALAGARRATQISANRLLLACLERFAAGAVDLGEVRRAVVALGAAEATRGEMGLAADEKTAKRRSQALDAARLLLGAEAVVEALEEGRARGLLGAYEVVSASPE